MVAEYYLLTPLSLTECITVFDRTAYIITNLG